MNKRAALQAADGSITVCEQHDCHSPATTPRYDGYFCAQHDPARTTVSQRMFERDLRAMIALSDAEKRNPGSRYNIRSVA